MKRINASTPRNNFRSDASFKKGGFVDVQIEMLVLNGLFI